MPIQDFIFHFIGLPAVSLIPIFSSSTTSPHQQIRQLFSKVIKGYPTKFLLPGLIGERIRGRPPLSALAWDEKFIAPYLSCFSPETSKASPPLRQLGAIFFKQLMRWPWVPTLNLKHSSNFSIQNTYVSFINEVPTLSLKNGVNFPF